MGDNVKSQISWLKRTIQHQTSIKVLGGFNFANSSTKIDSLIHYRNRQS